VTGHNYEILAKDKLWPFTVLDFQKANIGALQGAVTTQAVAVLLLLKRSSVEH